MPGCCARSSPAGRAGSLKARGSRRSGWPLLPEKSGRFHTRSRTVLPVRGAGEPHCSAQLFNQRSIADELDSVSEPPARRGEGGLYLKGFPVPQGRAKPVRVHFLDTPSPFVFTPAGIEIARKQMEVRLVEVCARIVGTDVKGALATRRGVAKPAPFHQHYAHTVVG